MNEQNLTPEAVYEIYRLTRPESSFPEASAIVTKSATVPESIAEQVYRHYQVSRISEREVAIEAIMSRIRQSNYSVDKNSAFKETADIETADTSRDLGTVLARGNSQDYTENKSNKNLASQKWASGFGLPSRILNRVIDKFTTAPTLFKFAVPTIAAGFLAIVLIPNVYKQSESHYTVPVALTQNATTLTDYVNNSTDGVSLGLSTPGNSVNKAFNRGSLSVDLSLAFLANQTDVMNGVIDKIRSTENKNEQSDLTNAAQQLHDVVNSVKTTNAIQNTSKQQLYAALQSQLTDFTSDATINRWIAQGQALESILIASQFALNSNDTQALEQALTAGKALSTAGLDHPSLKLINELWSFPQDQTYTPAQIRKIIAQAKNVKLLMQ